MRILNTLADVKVQSNSMILCDEKTDEELEDQDQDKGNDDPKKYEEAVEYVKFCTLLVKSNISIFVIIA